MPEEEDYELTLSEQDDLAPDLPLPPSKEVLARVGQYILDGLTEDEASMLAGYDPRDLRILRQNVPSLASFLDKEAVKFKHNQLKTVQKKGDGKTAQWLLEKLRPNEFAAKHSADSGNTQVNIFNRIIKEIQQGDQTPVTKVYDIEEALQDNGDKPNQIPAELAKGQPKGQIYGIKSILN